jgi:tetratricopeptide (TPR) repeat protein
MMAGTIIVSKPDRGAILTRWRSCLLALLMTLALPCLSQSSKPSLVDLQQQGSAALAAKEFPEAIQAYQQLLKLDPASEQVAIGLSLAYQGVYNHDEARRVLQRTSVSHPHSAASLIELGRIDIQLLHYDQAIGELQEAARRDPTSAAAHLDLGIAYQSKGESEKARAQFDEAIKHDPHSALAYYFRGISYADADDNERAYTDAQKSHNLDPAAVPAKVLLAKVATRLHKCDQAVELLRPLAEAEDVEIGNIYLLSRAYQCANQPDLARQTQDEFEQRSRQAESDRTRKMDADHLAEQAEEVAQKNQLAPALALLNQALEKDPQNGPAHAELAKIEFSRGDIAKAHDEIDIALKSSPYNPDYLYVLGKVLAKQGDSKSALDAFQKTVLVDPNESDAYYEMALIHSEHGERAQAIEEMKMAVKLSPDDVDYKNALDQLQKQH